MTSTLEETFKKRLQLIAKERKLAPAEVIQNVVLERFLVRLCKSKYRSNFILKGGTLLARHLSIGRETRDLDFTVERLSNDINNMCEIIREIVSLDLQDGFEFKNVKTESLDQFDFQYPGVQIRVDACFGRSRYSLFIDLGFGDHVKVKEENLLLLSNSKGPLFEQEISLMCYPLEFVFAEKLETVVFRGVENSRMKDYHDLLTLIKNENALNKTETLSAIEAVFKHRETALKLPLFFDEDSIKTLQNHWQRYRPSLVNRDVVPADIKDVIQLINNWITLS